MKNTTGTKNKSRILGSLYGVAIGDALGAPVEFMRKDSIKEQYGTLREMVGGGWLHVEPGEVTDDTQMTLCVARGIAANPQAPELEVGKEFIKWYKSNPKDVGGTCRSAISIAIDTADPEQLTENNWSNASLCAHNMSNFRSAGNGSLMRTAYIGLYYSQAQQVDMIARRISRLTHYDARASVACAAYSLAIRRLVNEAGPITKDDISTEITDRFGPFIGGFSREELTDTGFTPNPSGFVIDSLKSALHCFYTTDNFEDALVKAVNLGGDADTIGAITGGLAGAYYGFEAIPERWVKCLFLNLRIELTGLANIAVLSRI